MNKTRGLKRPRAPNKSMPISTYACFDEQDYGITSANLAFPKPPPAEPGQEGREDETNEIQEIIPDLEDMESEEEHAEYDTACKIYGSSTSNVPYFAESATEQQAQSSPISIIVDTNPTRKKISEDRSKWAVSVDQVVNKLENSTKCHPAQYSGFVSRAEREKSNREQPRKVHYEQGPKE